MTSEKKITKKELKGIFWRSMPMEASFNYERMMSIAFGFSMMGVIKKLYPKLHDQKEALKRHLEFFNCTSAMSPFILGVAASMEEKKANDPEFDVSSINAMKVGLMGPLAGIGDSFFWGTLRIIASGIGISLAKQGSVLGPLLFLVIYNVPNLLVRYYGTMLGYKTGVTFVEKMASGLMDNITFALNILGNTVIGGMIASMVIVKLPTKIAGGKDPQTIQTLLDSILPNAVPLLLTFFIAYLLKKKVNVFVILLVIIIISVLGAQFGFLGK
ncbi:PTS system mannose/fructose/sorbose family transporter subunit IID [Ligilactobacillus pobuzihii]|uniref:PTS system mannose fructose sorbose family IID component n=1 Tax=Ligilactobacillus pobuzihii TaxID=449659 RepID=A0A0R2LHY1_9LACO|nr:PTS system mannose/fructose/sorbose family transporter subunit IID [Ligilactobacillus pobuzihii]KRK09672.1 PTS system mannose fructose sorbose family IID component [Ligilactobacillus pobuzihii E100301 = KCTC 13174]KRN99180.1 PTS system mannose fructose sorbose family IID component [Ligilactobacillus pobuzihii]